MTARAHPRTTLATMSEQTAGPTAAEMSSAVARHTDRTWSDLDALVALPSVHGAEPDACARACALVVDRISGLPGFSRELVEVVPTSDGSSTVVAHRPAAEGRPTVLLYSHYDVQPAGDPDRWTDSPWELTARDGRWYGRGSADCKGNLVTHLTALRALADATGSPEYDGLGLRLVVEGSEETGGGGLDDLVAERPELFAADVILIVDSGNAEAGVPTLTTSLRGVANVEVTVETLRGGVHSGQYGGGAPDALAALVSLLASLRDPETGATTIDGLDCGGSWQGRPYTEEEFRRDAGVLDGVGVSTAAPLADLVWARPAATVLAIDCPRVDDAIAAVQPSARALVNLRVPPGMDPVEARSALEAHLRSRVPWDARISFGGDAVGYPFSAGGGPATELLGACLAEAYGAAEVEHIGSGGSIPLATALHTAHPEAEIALFGVEDPAAAIHSPDESVDPHEIERIAAAEALFLARVATR